MSRTAQTARMLDASAKDFAAVRPLYRSVINLREAMEQAILTAGLRDRAPERTYNLAILTADMARDNLISALDALGISRELFITAANEVL